MISTNDGSNAPVVVAKLATATAIYSIFFLNDGKEFLTAEVGGLVSRWAGFEQPAVISSFNTSPFQISRAALHPDENLLIASCFIEAPKQSVLQWWNLSENKLLAKMFVKSRQFTFVNTNAALEKDIYPSIGRIIFSPNGSFLIGGRGILFTYSLERREIVSEHDGDVYDIGTSSIAFHPNGAELAVSLAGETSSILRFATLDSAGHLAFKPEWDMECDSQAITGVKFSPDGSKLVFSDWDLHIYSYPERERLFSFNIQGDVYNPPDYQGYFKGTWSDPVFLNDSKTLAACSPQGTIFFWDVQTGEKLGAVKAHEGSATCLTLHPSEQYLVSAGQDKTLKIWRLQ